MIPTSSIYGPGIHEVGSLTVPSGKTVYVAGGAIVRGVIRPDEKFRISGYSGLKTYAPTFTLKGEKIVFRGRGIVDGSRLHDARAKHALGARPGHPDRRRDSARLEHLDDPHPPVRPRDGRRTSSCSATARIRMASTSATAAT